MGNRDIENTILDANKVSPRQETEISEEIERVNSIVLDNKDKASNIDLRKGLVSWMRWIVIVWLIFAGCVVIANLVINAVLDKSLSDVVVCTLLATTTTNVLGLAVIVLRGLFRSAK